MRQRTGLVFSPISHRLLREPVGRLTSPDHYWLQLGDEVNGAANTTGLGLKRRGVAKQARVNP
jgi:hypothetical protein